MMNLLPQSWKDDHSLLADALSGNQSASQTLVKRLLPKGYAMAWRVLGKTDEANDVVQEAFVRLWEKGQSIRPEASLSTYFNTIVIRLCIDRFRQQRRFVDEMADEVDAVIDFSGDGVEANEPEQHYVDKYAATKLQDALFKLPNRQRLVLVLWAYQERTMVDIAAVFEMNENAAYQLLHRAKRALKKILEEE